MYTVQYICYMIYTVCYAVAHIKNYIFLFLYIEFVKLFVYLFIYDCTCLPVCHSICISQFVGKTSRRRARLDQTDDRRVVATSVENQSVETDWACSGLPVPTKDLHVAEAMKLQKKTA